jgi:hypothetical protein
MLRPVAMKVGVALMCVEYRFRLFFSMKYTAARDSLHVLPRLKLITYEDGLPLKCDVFSPGLLEAFAKGPTRHLGGIRE